MALIPSEVTAALFGAQLEKFDEILAKSLKLCNHYYFQFKEVLPHVRVPVLAVEVAHNGHIFYLLTESEEERDGLLLFEPKRSECNFPLLGTSFEPIWAII